MDPLGFVVVRDGALGRAGEEVIIRGPGKDVIIQRRLPAHYSGLVLTELASGVLVPLDIRLSSESAMTQLRAVVGEPRPNLRLIP